MTTSRSHNTSYRFKTFGPLTEEDASDPFTGIGIVGRISRSRVGGGGKVRTIGDCAVDCGLFCPGVLRYADETVDVGRAVTSVGVGTGLLANGGGCAR